MLYLAGKQVRSLAGTEDKIKLFYKRLPSRRVSLRAVRRVGCREMPPSKYASTAGFNLNALRPTGGISRTSYAASACPANQAHPPLPL
jgi:hypothetical protein